MTGKERGSYEAPSVTDYGSVESVTEQRNKSSIGTDTDIEVIDLAGSVGFE